MAIQNLMLIDVDGPPPARGVCKISVDYDTITLLVTLVRFENSMIDPATFTITRFSDGRTRTISIPANTPASTLAPPFSPGNWTPAMQPNPNGGPPFIGLDWNITFRARG